jgi:hypothetical protein
MDNPGGSRFDGCMYANLDHSGPDPATTAAPQPFDGEKTAATSFPETSPGSGRIDGQGTILHMLLPGAAKPIPVTVIADAFHDGYHDVVGHNGTRYFGVPDAWLVDLPPMVDYGTLTVPGCNSRPVEVMGQTPEGDYLVAWRECIRGFISRKSMTVPPCWIGRSS